MERLTETLRIRFLVNLHVSATKKDVGGAGYEQFTSHHDNSTIPESIGLGIQRGNPVRNLLKRKTLYVSTCSSNSRTASFSMIASAPWNGEPSNVRRLFGRYSEVSAREGVVRRR